MPPNNSNGADQRRAAVMPILRRLWPYISGQGWRLAVAAVAVLLTAGLSLAVPAIIRSALDTIMISSRPVSLWGPAALIVLVGLLEGIASFGSRYMMESVGFNVTYRLRADFFRHLHELSFEFHDKAQVGDVMSRLTADTEALSRMYGFAIPYIAANTLTLFGVAAILLSWNWRLGLSFILLLPVMLMAMRGYAFQVQPAFRKARAALGKLSEVLRIAFGGVREIQLFGQEQREQARMEQQNQEHLRVNLGVAKLSAFWMPYVNFLVGVTTAVALAIGGWEVIAGRATTGTLVAFISYAGMLMRPIRQTGMLTASVVQAVTAADRVLEIVDQPSAVQEAPGATELPPLQGKIQLRGVHFAYEPGQPVLTDVNLTVQPGEVVALVGPTGAGKTTLVHLVPRFYDPQQGQVLLDGHDVRTVTLSSLRRQVGTALQRVFLFNGTIRANIAFGKPEATFGEVQTAARLAQIHDEIMAMPHGYDTPLGEGGAGLSGGQRQRLALARVLLTDPRVLILDEVSSELDAITEAKLRTALEQSFAGRSTLVIAHRLWTVQRADRIVVLDQGRIVQEGTHAALLAESGLYREIYTALVGAASTSDQPGGEPK